MNESSVSGAPRRCRRDRHHCRPHLEALEPRLPPGDTVLGMLAFGAFASFSHPRIVEPANAADGAVWKIDLWPDESSVVPAWQATRPNAVTPDANQQTANDMLFTAPATELPEIAASRRQIGAAYEPTDTRGMGFPNMLTAPVTGGTAASVHGELAFTRLAAHTAAVPSLRPKTDSVPTADQAVRGAAMYFEKNMGQTDGKVDFLARAPGYTLLLTPTEAVMSISPPSERDSAGELGPAPVDEGAVVRMQIVGGNPSAGVNGVDQLQTKVNYYLGNDPNQWHAGVPTFAKVQYDDVYPGVDLVYYGQGRDLEYDFVVSPGADPNQIALSFSGADSIDIDTNGSLVLQAGGHEIRQPKPYIYQEINGNRQEVAGQFRIQSTESGIRDSRLKDSALVTFDVGAYDVARPLVIDPAVVLGYSTYLGGASTEYGYDVAVDSAGSAYVVGITYSASFPVFNPAQTTYAGAGDAFVAKFTPGGTALEYATWLGGSPSCNALGEDSAFGVAVDAFGSAYIVGTTQSCNFPVLNAFQPEFGGGGNDAFIAKLTAGGALVYSSYLGGDGYQSASAVAVDGDGIAHMIGTVANGDGFPIVDAIQPVFGDGNRDFFIAKVSRDGRTLLYSTFLGGSSADGDAVDAGAIALDPFGNICVTGFTNSFDFPTFNAFQPTKTATTNAFVTKLTPDGSAFVFSTYLGGSGGHADRAHGIATDAAGNVYVTGSTSAHDFPLANPFQETDDASWTGFVTKFKADGSELIYSTYLGGNGEDSLRGIAVDDLGFAYIWGTTVSTDLPVKQAFQPAHGGGWYDMFIAKLAPEGNALAFCSYLGGSNDDHARGLALDHFNNIYVAGFTLSPNFPLIKPFQGTKNGGYDAFLTKIRLPAKHQAQASRI